AAIADAEFEVAQTYYERAIQLGNKREPEDDLHLALAKFRTGDVDAAQAILDRIAPDNGLGYPKAHRLKAMQLVAALTQSDRFNAGGADEIDPLTVAPSTVNQSAWETVRLHLTRSGLEQPVELGDLWTAYYLAAGKTSDAIARQMEVSHLEPQRWVVTARLCASLNDQRQRKIACDRAETYLTAKITDNPFDHLARIDLARVFVDNQRWEDADALVGEGLGLVGADTTPPALALRRAASELLLIRFDSINGNSDGDLEKKHTLVAKAIELDSNHLRAYGKLLELYQASGSPEDRERMIRMLEQQIAQGNSIAIAHFALGTAKWIDGGHDEAVWHTERAIQLQPSMTDVANNLAWLLAHGQSPDLQRALAMIETALAKRPGDCRYLDTRGTILMKLQRWNDALADFESILPLVPPKARPGVHQNLAEIYAAVDKPEIARLHRDEAARTKTLSDNGTAPLR
ncbi:MAG TPA: hypothetical protein DDZ51_09435, partial [Planctomycetaceae bacterium]|nr:hypothetical protein [Planctomycetaceae bacterium]